MRPRVVIYGAVCVGYLLALVFLVVNRKPAEFQLIREAHDAPFALIDEQTVTNHYKLHLRNRADTSGTFSIENRSAAAIRLTVPVPFLVVNAGAETEIPLFFTFPRTILAEGKGAGEIEVRYHGGSGDAKSLGRVAIPLIGPDR